MQKKDCYFLGKVTKPHALKGEVILWLDVDNPDVYDKLKGVFLEIKNELVPFSIDNIQIRGKKSIAKFDGIDIIEKTENIIGADMYLPLSTLPKLSGKKFYYHEVIGYEIFDQNSEKTIGQLKTIYESSGQDLFAIDINEIEVLIPIVDEFILQVDHTLKTIRIAAPEGLIDVYLS
jgi:16S rRNA processing protein RimM